MMSISPHDILCLAAASLRRNALHSALAALGIAVGVTAVVAMVTIGRGSRAKVDEQIGQLGTQLLTLRVGQDSRGGKGAQIEAKPMRHADVEAVRAFHDELQAVGPIASAPLRVVSRLANWVATVAGADNEFFAARRWHLASGRLFTAQDIQAGRNVCVIGATVRERLFGGGAATGETIRIKTVPCEIVGVLRQRGQSGLAQDDDNVVVMPLAGYQRRIVGNRDVQGMLILVRQGIDPSHMKSRIEELMRERRRIAGGQDDNFHVIEMRQLADAMAGSSRTLAALLSAIAAISLLVGGIGIMNIMLASVADRTAEIGIRLAIGALPQDILAEVLAEATLLAIAGGLAGLVAGVALAGAASLYLQIPLLVDATFVLLAVALSGTIGIAFGYLPAAKAARLDPVEAVSRA